MGKKRLHKKEGFTLIELLVTVAIIGILAAIAIPMYRSYKQKGYDTTAETDLRNLKIVVESFFADNRIYPH